MEQATQQISQKPPFPIKTKIVAWWMIIINGIFVLFFIRDDYYRYVIYRHEIVFSLGGMIKVYLMFLLPVIAGFFLLRKKKWAWWVSIIIYGLISLYFFSRLFTLTIFTVGLNVFDFYYLLYFLVPLILFILDRKNFFKIASQNSF